MRLGSPVCNVKLIVLPPGSTHKFICTRDHHCCRTRACMRHEQAKRSVWPPSLMISILDSAKQMSEFGVNSHAAQRPFLGNFWTPLMGIAVCQWTPSLSSSVPYWKHWLYTKVFQQLLFKNCMILQSVSASNGLPRTNGRQALLWQASLSACTYVP